MRCFIKYIWLLISVFLMSAAVTVPASSQDRVIVFAASSMKDALDQISASFEVDHPEIDIILSYASSGVLARQIANDAPVDVFVSASTDWMNYLVEQNQVKPNDIKSLAENQLVVVAPTNTSDEGEWRQILERGRFVMGDPSHVPAGIYAKQALTAQSLWVKVSQNAVFTENIRVALGIVERQEAGAGILYQSDVQLSDRLQIIHRFSDKDHAKISYPVVRLNAANDAAGIFFDYLFTQGAQSTLAAYGFNSVGAQTASGAADHQIFENPTPYLWPIIFLSLQVAFVAMLFAVPLAYAVAFLLARYEFRGKAFVQALVMTPLVMPPVVTGYLLLLLFGSKGEIGQFLSYFGVEFAFKWTGAALAAGLMAFPLLVRPMRLSIEAIDQGIVEAANTLGANVWTRFRTVFLPLSLPGIIAGAVLGFAKSLGEFGATITFVSNIPDETQTLSLAIYSFLQSPNGDDAALTLMLISIAIALGAVLLSEMVSSRLYRKGQM